MKKVLVLEKATFGGQITSSPCVENYPGYVKMSGNEFADKLLDQVLSMGADVEMEKVTGIMDEGSRKLVFADNKKYEAIRFGSTSYDIQGHFCFRWSYERSTGISRLIHRFLICYFIKTWIHI